MAAKSGVTPSTTSPSPSRGSVSPSSSSPSPSRSPVVPSGDTGTCTVTYRANSWSTGFTADVTIANRSTAGINGWSLAWSFAGNQVISNAWNATVTQSGTAVTARNAAYNATIAAGASVSFGFQASYSGSNAAPAAFTLNGTACTTQ